MLKLYNVSYLYAIVSLNDFPLQEVVKPSSNSRQVDNVKKDVNKTAKKPSKRAYMLTIPIFSSHVGSVNLEPNIALVNFYVGDSDKAKSEKELAREIKLQEEAAVRKSVEAIKRRLSLVLKALGLVAIANPAKTHEQLPALVSSYDFIFSSILCLLALFVKSPYENDEVSVPHSYHACTWLPLCSNNC